MCQHAQVNASEMTKHLETECDMAKAEVQQKLNTVCLQYCTRNLKRNKRKLKAGIKRMCSHAIAGGGGGRREDRVPDGLRGVHAPGALVGCTRARREQRCSGFAPCARAQAELVEDVRTHERSAREEHLALLATRARPQATLRAGRRPLPEGARRASVPSDDSRVAPPL